MSRKQVMNPLHALLDLVYYPLAVITLYADAFPPHQQACKLNNKHRHADVYEYSVEL